MVASDDFYKFKYRFHEAVFFATSLQVTCHYGSRDLEYPVPYSNAITLDLRFVSFDFKTDFLDWLLVAKLLYTYFLTVNPFASHSVTLYGKCDCFGFYSVGKLVVNLSKHKFLRIMMFCIIRQVFV